MYRKRLYWGVNEDGRVYPEVANIMIDLGEFSFIIEICKQTLLCLTK